jgi:hypothetical protein
VTTVFSGPANERRRDTSVTTVTNQNWKRAPTVLVRRFLSRQTGFSATERATKCVDRPGLRKHAPCAFVLRNSVTDHCQRPYLLVEFLPVLAT